MSLAKKRQSFLIPLLAMLLMVGSAGARPKTDILVLENGDYITCEIKQLTAGKLKIKTDSMGTIDVEWDDIAALQSDFYYRIETSSGQRLYGSLNLSEEEMEMHIVGSSQEYAFEKSTIVEIMPIERTFWSKLDGSLSFGFSFVKASEVAQLTYEWSNLYRTERNLYDLRSSSIITNQGVDSTTTRRLDLSFAFTRLMVKRLTGTLKLSAQRNDQMDLQRRLLPTVTMGISPLKSNQHVLRLSMGVALNSELVTGETEAVTSAEGVFSASYALFEYDSPKTDLNTIVNFYPSLTEEARYRFDFEFNVRRELVSDLFLEISYYTSYDSNPSGDAPLVDYSIVTSLGWTY